MAGTYGPTRPVDFFEPTAEQLAEIQATIILDGHATAPPLQRRRSRGDGWRGGQQAIGAALPPRALSESVLRWSIGGQHVDDASAVRPCIHTVNIASQISSVPDQMSKLERARDTASSALCVTASQGSPTLDRVPRQGQAAAGSMVARPEEVPLMLRALLHEAGLRHRTTQLVSPCYAQLSLMLVCHANCILHSTFMCGSK
jgi:hypothetical protein